MANNGIPVRLSEGLTSTARAAAAVTERSLTEQVEHWARLGAAVEAVVSHRTVTVLKTRSHDPELAARLSYATTDAGRAHAARLIASRDPVRHGVDVEPSRRGSAAGDVAKAARAKRRK